MLQSLWRATIRTGFRLLYNEMAWSYDGVSWLVSLGAWQQWQRCALPFVQGKRVLELGYGPGHMLLRLEQAGLEVTGCDLSPFMGRQAQRRLRRAGQRANLVRARAQALPFAPATFDTVLATFPTEYIVEDKTLAAAHRVLAPAGRLVIVPEGHLTGAGPHHRLIEWLFAITGQRQGVFAVDDEERWPASAAWVTIRQRFAARGFNVEMHQATLARSVATVVVAIKR